MEIDADKINGNRILTNQFPFLYVHGIDISRIYVDKMAKRRHIRGDVSIESKNIDT